MRLSDEETATSGESRRRRKGELAVNAHDGHVGSLPQKEASHQGRQYDHMTKRTLDVCRRQSFSQDSVPSCHIIRKTEKNSMLVHAANFFFQFFKKLQIGSSLQHQV